MRGSLTEVMGLLSSNTCQRLWHMVIYCWVDSVTLFSLAFISSATFCERVLTASFTLILLKLSSSRLFSVRLHIIFVFFHADKLSIYDPIKHTVCLVSMFEWIGACCLWIHCCTNYLIWIWEEIYWSSRKTIETSAFKLISSIHWYKCTVFRCSITDGK